MKEWVIYVVGILSTLSFILTCIDIYNINEQIQKDPGNAFEYGKTKDLMIVLLFVILFSILINLPLNLKVKNVIWVMINIVAFIIISWALNRNLKFNLIYRIGISFLIYLSFLLILVEFYLDL
jgi:hypothetical protein